MASQAADAGPAVEASDRAVVSHVAGAPVAGAAEPAIDSDTHETLKTVARNILYMKKHPQGMDVTYMGLMFGLSVTGDKSTKHHHRKTSDDPLSGTCVDCVTKEEIKRQMKSAASKMLSILHLPPNTADIGRQLRYEHRFLTALKKLFDSLGEEIAQARKEAVMDLQLAIKYVQLHHNLQYDWSNQTDDQAALDEMGPELEKLREKMRQELRDD